MNWVKSFWRALTKGSAEANLSSLEPIRNFTPRAQQVLALARKEADRFNHNFVGTEHLLLGLVKLGQGLAINVLRNLGLNLETIRTEVENCVGTGPDQKVICSIPYTPRVKKVLALAVKEAKALNHTYIGTEHILLGLLGEGDNVAARVLKNLDVDIEKTRREILKELEPNFTDRNVEIAAPLETRADAATSLKVPEKEWGYFTPRARQVLELAYRDASRFNHSFVGTEHLLLGLLKLGKGIAVNALKKLGLDYEIVCKEVEKHVGVGLAQPITGNIPFTPQAKNILVIAQNEANSLHHTYVGTEHILLGLLHDDGITNRIFKNLQVEAKLLQKEILREIDPNFTPGEN